MVAPEMMRAGDVLLYSGDGLFNRIIRLKTWSRYSHVEVYDGLGFALASRNGIGVGRYPVRLEGLTAIYRPRPPIHMNTARAWFTTVDGQGYDWFGLLAFTSAKIQGRDNGKMFCSEFAARLLRHAIGGMTEHPTARKGNARVLAALGLDPWNGYDADGIAPGEFAKSALLLEVSS